MDYSQFHVVINIEYLAIMHKKAMEKASINIIRETHSKEMEKNRVKKFANYFILDEQASSRTTTKNAKVDFEYNWFTTIVKKTWQHLHEHLRAS